MPDMNTKRFLALATAMFVAGALCFAQTEKTQVIEGGGTGPWKSVAVADASLPTHTIYRPENIKAYVDEKSDFHSVPTSSCGRRSSRGGASCRTRRS